MNTYESNSSDEYEANKEPTMSQPNPFIIILLKRLATLLKDVERYVKCCHICQVTSKKIPESESAMKITTCGLFERFGIDFIGPLPKTEKGNRYIIVAVEYLTKWVVARALPIDTAAEAAKFIFEEIVCVFGLPSIISSDRGSHFLGQAVEQLLLNLVIKHKISTAYHPKSNGLVESCNKQIGRLLRNCVFQDPRKWAYGSIG